MRSTYLCRALLICAGLLLHAEIAFACSCAPVSPVLDEFEDSQVVIIARIISVDKVDPNNKEEHSYNGVRSVTASVEKVYKGNVRMGDALVFSQDGPGLCSWPFSEDYVGHGMLFYLNMPQTESEMWRASTCSRSNSLERATEDLLYLDNLKKLRGKTRVSGHYLDDSQYEGFDSANKKIRIVGEKKTYVTRTNDKGVFEIYDLPPGAYRLEPEISKGWKIARRTLFGMGAENNSTNPLAFTLEPKRHRSIDVYFEPDNAVEGGIVDPHGNPINNVCAYLWTPEQTEGYGPTGCTNEKGEFRIESAAPGNYILVINPGGASSRQNFSRLFYPGVTERGQAALININAGEIVKGINIVIPELVDTVTVRGLLLYSDDTAAVESVVRFTAVPKDGIDGGVSMVTTDADGRFSLKLVKSLKGELSSDFSAGVGWYMNCPKLDELFIEGDTQFLTIKTLPLKIDASQDMDNLVLRFPIPKCKRKASGSMGYFPPIKDP